MNDRMLTITVKEDIYKYVTESLQSDYVILKRKSNLLDIIKPHLSLYPDEWELKPMPEGFRELPFELPYLRRVYEARNGKVYYCNTLFRDHLTAQGLEKVRRFFWNSYNNSFNNFLSGWVERQHFDNEISEEEKRIQVINGIVAFFNNYHIDFDEKMVQSRRQAWTRYTEKVDKYQRAPLLF